MKYRAAPVCARWWLRVAAIITAVVFVFAVSASTQTLYGSIVGLVKDAQGAVVPGATVTIVGKQTNLTRESITDAQGNYSFVNVLPGPYDLALGSGAMHAG